MTTDHLTSEAQAVLDELTNEGRLPFKLDAREIVPAGDSVYEIRFHDSRLHSVAVSWVAGQSFKEVVRAAVLEKVSSLSRPLKRKGQ